MQPKLAVASSGGTLPPDDPPPSYPLLDLGDPRVVALLTDAKTRGYVTFDALNAVLPQEQITSEQIEGTMSTLYDLGITVVDSSDS